MSDEFDAIPMDAPIAVEDFNQIIPEGEYNFKVLQLKREQKGKTDRMPAHLNLRFELQLSGNAGTFRTWDNMRMYNKWKWKYAEIARAIDPINVGKEEILINWDKFTGSEGKLKLTHKDWKKDDGTVEKLNQFKYLKLKEDGEKEIPF